REKIARAKGRARDAGDRARDASPAEQAAAGGIVVASVGAAVAAAVLMRRRGSSRTGWRSRMPMGRHGRHGWPGRHRGHRGRVPVRVRFGKGRRPAVEVRRRRRSIF
ncbi:MAG: hypothetical protein ACRDNL_24750, partial [Spirillospora sp.]